MTFNSPTVISVIYLENRRMDQCLNKSLFQTALPSKGIFKNHNYFIWTKAL
jgi:hypothetical protein